MKSTKTTVAGIATGVGIIASLISNIFSVEGATLFDIFATENLSMLVAGIGAILMGLFARDDDITSEGGTAPKDAKK
jgi:hypothetical protein